MAIMILFLTRLNSLTTLAAWLRISLNVRKFKELPILLYKIVENKPKQGGDGSYARNDWVAPDACCDDKPYNTGVKVVIDSQ